MMMTAEQLLGLPRGAERRELVDGCLRTRPLVGFRQGKISFDLAATLAAFVTDHDLGEGFAAQTGFLLRSDPNTVRSPSAGFVARERIARVGIPKGYFPGAPDLAIEVISHDDAVPDVVERVDDWLDHGGVEVWVVHAERQTVTVYRSRTDFTVLTHDDTLESSRLLPGFRIPLHSVFPES